MILRKDAAAARAIYAISTLARAWDLEIHLSWDQSGAVDEDTDYATWRADNSMDNLSQHVAIEHTCLAMNAKFQNDHGPYLQSKSGSTAKNSLTSILLAVDVIPRHFILRAIYCVLGSCKPLTAMEVFLVTKTKILNSDIDWPYHINDTTQNVEELMRLSQRFLAVDSAGNVRLRSQWLIDVFTENSCVQMHDVHLFMALVCLKTIEEWPRILLRPWLQYHELKKINSLHEYTINNWHHHYLSVDGYSQYLQEHLRTLLQKAWVAERAAGLTHISMETGKNAGLAVLTEALDVGLEFCKAYEIQDLQKTYIRMGANPTRTKQQIYDREEPYRQLMGSDLLTNTTANPFAESQALTPCICVDNLEGAGRELPFRTVKAESSCFGDNHVPSDDDKNTTTDTVLPCWGSDLNYGSRKLDSYETMNTEEDWQFIESSDLAKGE